MMLYLALLVWLTSHRLTLSDTEPVNLSTKVISGTAAIVPQVTCELPPCPIPPERTSISRSRLRMHRSHWPITRRGCFVDVLLTSRRLWQHGTPSASETHFGIVLACSVEGNTALIPSHNASYHLTLIPVTISFEDFGRLKLVHWLKLTYHLKGDILCKREAPSGRFVVPLPKNIRPIGESRSQAVLRLLSLERTLHAKS